MSDYVPAQKQLTAAGVGLDSVSSGDTWYFPAKPYSTISATKTCVPATEAGRLVSDVCRRKLRAELGETADKVLDGSNRTFIDVLTGLLATPISDDADFEQRDSDISAMWEKLDCELSADFRSQARRICSIQDPVERKTEIRDVVAEFRSWAEAKTSDDLIFYRCFFTTLLPSDQEALEESLPESVRALAQHERDAAAFQVQERLIGYIGSLPGRRHPKGTKPRKAPRRA